MLMPILLAGFFRYDLQEYLMIIPAALIAITFHELSHGVAAYWLGDNTAKLQGRLTLNPFAHLDLFGLLCMIVIGIGWAKPVPVNPYNFKHPKWGMALTALAGPLSNVVLAFFCTLIALYITFASTSAVLLSLAQFLYLTATLSAGLAVFNLIPVPPLDGSKLLYPLLPHRVTYWLNKYASYFLFAFFALMILGVFSDLIGAGQVWIMNGIMSFIIRIFYVLGVL